MARAIRALILSCVAVFSLGIAARADDCPFKEGDAVDVEWWSSYASWHPAVVTKVEGSGAACGIFFRYLEGPEGAFLDKDQVFSLAHSHIRAAQLPRPGAGEPQQAALNDPDYHLCKGSAPAAYLGADATADPVAGFKQHVVERLQGDFRERLAAVDFADFEVHEPFKNDYQGTWHYPAPAGGTVYPITTTETYCIQDRTTSHTATYESEYLCYMTTTDRMQCDRPTFRLVSEEFRDKIE